LDRPHALQERIFKKFFDVAEVANLSKDEYAKYWESEKNYYDIDGAFRTASNKGFERGMAKGRAEGLAEGRAEGIDENRRENARRMKAKSFAVADIADITGLSPEEIIRI
jgi:predicted transposase/invertase (TIGR01784 family)